MTSPTDEPERFELVIDPHLWHLVLKTLERRGLVPVDITQIMSQAEDFDPRVRTFMLTQRG